MTSNAAPKHDVHNLTISRSFNAPREKVFKAWTKSRHLIHWWGPEGFSMPSHKMDIHPNGIYRCDLKDSNGKDHWVQGVFKEMIEPSHLAFTHSWEENGASTPETLVSIELTEENGKTDMVFYQAGFETTKDSNSHRDGWNSSFDKLEQYLATDQDF